MQMETHLVRNLVCKTILIDTGLRLVDTHAESNRHTSRTWSPSIHLASKQLPRSLICAMGHRRRCPRQHGCLSFPSPPSVMAAGWGRPGQWPGQHPHYGVPLCGLPAAAALDGTSRHHTAKDARQLRGNTQQGHLVARSRAARSGWGRVKLSGEQCDRQASGSGAIGRGHCSHWRREYGAGVAACGRGRMGSVPRRSVSGAVISDAAAGEKKNNSALHLLPPRKLEFYPYDKWGLV